MTRREFLAAGAGAVVEAHLARGLGQKPVATEPARTMVLWYRQPAADWNEALPIGNGRLGAMIFGRVAAERIQINEDTVWSGYKSDRVNPKALANLPKVRRLLFEGKPLEAQSLAEKTMMGIPLRLLPYQPLGDLLLTFPGAATTAEAYYLEDYRRELDLDTAVARVSYSAGGARFEREVFSSAPAQVIVVRLTCSEPGRISFSAALAREQDGSTEVVAPDRLILTGEAIPRESPKHPQAYKGWKLKGVHFAAVLRVIPEGGKMTVSGQEVTVQGADAATLLLAAATDFRGSSPRAACDHTLDAVNPSYTQLRSAHIADHQKFFRRVEINLEGPHQMGNLEHTPTDDRLARVQSGRPDPQLVTQYFQLGRYLLISSSRPGTLPANLQGIWNERMNPPWDSKYTLNINAEMNYWPVEVANLAEMHGPLFDLVERMQPSGERTAREMYGVTSGGVAHHNTDIWCHTAPLDGVGPGMWPSGLAWLSLHFWQHYEFSRDPRFLAKRAYPALKSAAQFLLGYLVDNGKGHLVTGPSVSPENAYVMPDGTVASLCMGPTMDIEIAYAILTHTAEASQLLGRDAEFRSKVLATRARLLPLQIGKQGQLQEWAEDYSGKDLGHRHFSPLFAFYPGDQITLEGTPALARASRILIEQRLDHGGGSTGWSRAWAINLLARLREAEKAYESVQTLLAKYTFPNLLDRITPSRRTVFQIDGNLGGTAGIMEMLLQSRAGSVKKSYSSLEASRRAGRKVLPWDAGEVAFLPALPAEWPSGRFRGLRARGGLEVDLEWRKGRATTATLRASVTAIHRLRPPSGQRITGLRSQGQKLSVAREKNGAVRFTAESGRTYSVTFS